MHDAREEAKEKAAKAGVVSDTDGYTYLLPFNLTWIAPDHWTRMINGEWSTPKWTANAKKAQKNRTTESEGSSARYSGGSVSIIQHRIRMTNELGRDARMDEVFGRTHTSKVSREVAASGSGPLKFINSRVERYHKEYLHRMEEVYGSDVSSHPVGDIQIWNAITGGPSKGRLYGCGGSGDPHYIVTGAPSAHSTSRSVVGDETSSEEVKILKSQVEDMKKKLEEQTEHSRRMEEKMEKMFHLFNQNNQQ